MKNIIENEKSLSKKNYAELFANKSYPKRSILRYFHVFCHFFRFT